MAWRLVEIWRDHRHEVGARKGETHRAFPRWSTTRQGFDIYPPHSNELKDAELVSTLEAVYDRVSGGLRVRCIIPTTGDTPILKGGFQARFELE